MLVKCCLFLLLFNLGDAFEEPSEYNDEEQEKPEFFTLDGVVVGGNFSRYELKFGKPMRIVLQSLEGDADIYFSYKDQAVSYELNKHDISSTTCGLDHVDVRSFPQPVYLGIYGYPSRNESSYRLLIIVSKSGNLQYDPELIHRWEELHQGDIDGRHVPLYIEILSWILEILVDILV